MTMHLKFYLLCVVLFWIALGSNAAYASKHKKHEPKKPSAIPTITENSNLVYLDATVLDKSGHPVVSGLTQQDFTITDQKQPETITSFTTPAMRRKTANGAATRAIFVLDEMNDSSPQGSYLRNQLIQYLESQPARLRMPMQLMMFKDNALQLVEPFSRSRSKLLNAAKKMDVVLPFIPYPDPFTQSMEALQMIALECHGSGMRTNVLWLGGESLGEINLEFTGDGNGGSSIESMDPMPSSWASHLAWHAQMVTNMLVNDRMALYVLMPGTGGELSFDPNDPYASGISMNQFIYATGGQYLFSNDIPASISKALALGSNYYTLTYQPQNVPADGKFRQVKVTMSNPGLKVITAKGYFAPDKHAPAYFSQTEAIDLVHSLLSTIPITGLDLTVTNIVRHPKEKSVEITALVKGRGLDWEVGKDGKRTTLLEIAAATVNAQSEIIASHVRYFQLSVDDLKTPDADLQAESKVSILIHYPYKSYSIHVAVMSENGKKIGATVLYRKQIMQAPAEPMIAQQTAAKKP